MTNRKHINYDHLPRSIITWIEANIMTPIEGFEHKKRSDGTEISFEEQMIETKYQLITVADYFYSRGNSETRIIEVLTKFKKG